jgi:hypothetical protein
VRGPLQIAYTIRDDYGNTSAGIINVKPWNNALIPRGNIVYGTNQILLSGGGTVPLNTPIVGTIVGTNTGSATVRFGDGTGMTVATPSTTSLVLGEVVTSRVQKPLDVDGTQEPCTFEAGENCFPASWASVTITPGAATESGFEVPPTGNTLFTVSTDMCGFHGVRKDDPECPYVRWTANFFPPPTGEGPPPDGDVDVFYSYRYYALSSAPEDEIEFSHTGTLPPGLTLSTDGLLSGTPTANGLYTFTVIPTGSVTKATNLGVTHTVRI